MKQRVIDKRILINSVGNCLIPFFRYREAKTKFIFDPESGNVELEQKLPMSWHAFNETPKFEVFICFNFICKLYF